MAKEPNYTSQEIKKIQELLDHCMSYEEIAHEIGRTINGIKLKITRNKDKFKLHCLECWEERGWGSKYFCKSCAEDRKRKCSLKWYEDNKHWWKDTRYERYRFGGNRMKAKQRDGFICVKCGMTEEEHIEKFACELTVDHIDGLGRNSDVQNNLLENLQTLCLPCHGYKDSKRRCQK